MVIKIYHKMCVVVLHLYDDTEACRIISVAAVLNGHSKAFGECEYSLYVFVIRLKC